MYNMAPKYKKIEIILNTPSSEKLNLHTSIVKNIEKKEEEDPKIKKITDPILQNKEKFVFYDAALVVSGSFIIITQEYGDDEIGSERTTTGRIFNLVDVFSYKAYFEER